MTQVKMNMDGFKIIEKSLKDNYKTRVGILGSNAKQMQGDMTMADIGAVQEFGSHSMNIPKRSFLRMPLETKIWDWVKKNSANYYEMMKKSMLRKWYIALGLGAEEIIDEAFNTKGFGNWAENAPITVHGGWMRNPINGALIEVKGKGSSAPLIDTGALKRSISSKVISDDK